jgi:hypothetical protein
VTTKVVLQEFSNMQALLAGNKDDVDKFRSVLPKFNPEPYSADIPSAFKSAFSPHLSPFSVCLAKPLI